MDNNGVFNNTHGGPGILGLEISLTNPNYLQQTYPYVPKQKASQISDEEEQHNNLNIPATTDDNGGAGDGKLRKGSPWQRMKWTDNMVKLLIMVVFYIGDEVVSEQIGSDKKRGGGGGGGGGVLQKKGKWKSVSKAMMEKGFYVSPQQCEDKFNDLNKRYKRVNDILGKGVACKVVENQSLLETMNSIPAKLKEEVKKLLNSKHLFFREMCAYHNSCAGAGAGNGGSGVGGDNVGGGGGGGGDGVVTVAHHSSPPEVTGGEPPQHRRQKCVHSVDDEYEEDDDEYDDCYERGEEEDEGLSKRKRGRTGENEGDESMIHRFKGEVSCVIEDLSKSVWEKKQWMKVKRMQLEEQRLGFEGETYELEKRRLRWVKFCWSREREMEVEKVRNERMKLEYERMVILLKQKEIELVDVQ